MRVHRAEGEAFVDQHVDQLRVVELGQLLGHDRRRLDQLAVELRLGPAVLAEEPLAGRPVAGVVAHRGQEGDEVGAEVAEHRDADAGDGEDRDQQRVVEGRERTSRRSGRRGRAAPKIMKMFHSSGTASGKVERMWRWKMTIPATAIVPIDAALGDEQDQRQGELDRPCPGGRRARRSTRAAGPRGGRGRGAASPPASGSRACC